MRTERLGSGRPPRLLAANAMAWAAPPGPRARSTCRTLRRASPSLPAGAHVTGGARLVDDRPVSDRRPAAVRLQPALAILVEYARERTSFRIAGLDELTNDFTRAPAQPTSRFYARLLTRLARARPARRRRREDRICARTPSGATSPEVQRVAPRRSAGRRPRPLTARLSTERPVVRSPRRTDRRRNSHHGRSGRCETADRNGAQRNRALPRRRLRRRSVSASRSACSARRSATTAGTSAIPTWSRRSAGWSSGYPSARKRSWAWGRRGSRSGSFASPAGAAAYGSSAVAGPD